MVNFKCAAVFAAIAVRSAFVILTEPMLLIAVRSAAVIIKPEPVLVIAVSLSLSKVVIIPSSFVLSPSTNAPSLGFSCTVETTNALMPPAKSASSVSIRAPAAVSDVVRIGHIRISLNVI